jgi:hypothetical protein
MTVPKPPAFDAQTSANAWTKHVLKDDGSQYSAFGKFPTWKQWADRLRDYVEANRVGLSDQKKDLDAQQAKISQLNSRVAALEARPPASPFPGSG